jgi:succinoglycan biosynthesis protein ExoM
MTTIADGSLPALEGVRSPLGNMDHVSVCVCTFRRNELLEKLLRKLEAQETGGHFDFSIVVVDNDAAGGAKGVAAKLQPELKTALKYDIEPDKCIAAARNRAVGLARGNYIAFIDDDEFPPQDWLLTLYRAIQLFDADGALGPVYPYFDTPPPAWLVRSEFCERPVHRTGTWLHWEQTRTGNVLLKRRVFDQHGLWFDVKYRTSGSDKEYFREAMALGYRFVAVEEAPVYETVPPTRQTSRYYLTRAIVQASNERKFRAPYLRGLSRFSAPLRVMAALTVYSVILPFSLLRGKHAAIKCLEKCAYHLSWLLAMIGVDLAKQRNF